VTVKYDIALECEIVDDDGTPMYEWRILAGGKPARWIRIEESIDAASALVLILSHSLDLE
jgi:hypothetical protein